MADSETKTKLKCPNCGSEDVVQIRYGIPTESMIEASKEGKIRLGGYAVGRGRPEFACNNCGHLW